MISQYDLNMSQRMSNQISTEAIQLMSLKLIFSLNWQKKYHFITCQCSTFTLSNLTRGASDPTHLTCQRVCENMKFFVERLQEIWCIEDRIFTWFRIGSSGSLLCNLYLILQCHKSGVLSDKVSNNQLLNKTPMGHYSQMCSNPA
jgi:hypothetical protein